MTGSLIRDIEIGSSPELPIRRFLRRARAWVEQHRAIRWAYRFTVGVLGTLVILLGVVMIPLPGPGWLVVFLGVAILGTEFPTARRIAVVLKRVLTRVWTWWRARRSARVERRARNGAVALRPAADSS